VPTVSIYTIQDDIVQPEIINPTSVLPGASSVSVQQLCGLTYLADHFTYVRRPSPIQDSLLTIDAVFLSLHQRSISPILH
jgi:hypothetical protein